MKQEVVFLVLFLPLVCGAEVYRCQDGGTTVFSATPCGPGARAVVVRPASGVGASAEDGNPSATGSALLERADLASRKRILADEIWRKERQIASLQSEHEARQAELREKKSRANNNLAGATWEKSISEEMQSVTADYATRTGVLLKELEGLREKRKALDVVK